MLPFRKFTYRKSGFSGRGEGRIRYYVDLTDQHGTRYIGTIEGLAGDWTHDMQRIDEANGVKTIRFPTREAASLAFMVTP